MRLTRLIPAALATTAAGCFLESPKQTPTTPPIIGAPTAGQVFDRCLIGVRTNMPDFSDPNAPGSSVSISSTDVRNVTVTGHIDWRVNGGPSQEVEGVAVDRDPTTPFVFGATLVPGMNHLEAGRCDEVDFCGWTPVDVVVQLQSGSPDCSFAGTGQPLFEKYGNALGVTPLSDGRVLVAVTAGDTMSPAMGLIALKADGTPDKSWGTNGVSLLPAVGLTPYVFPAPDGTFLIVLARSAGPVFLAHLSATGAFDSSFGDPMNSGFKSLSMPAPGGASVLAAVQGASGKLLIAGGAVMDAMKFSTETAYVMELGFDGTPGMFTLFGDPVPYQQVLAAAVDPMGNAAGLFDDHVLKGSLSGGLDKSFGTSGSAPAPHTGGTAVVFDKIDDAVVFSPGGIVVAQHVLQTPSDVVVRFYDATGASSDAQVPFQSDHLAGDAPTLLAAGSDGSVYVASTMVHPADVAHAWSKDQPGEDIAVARLRNKALDGSFGSGGFARVNSAMAWAKAATDAVTNVPRSLSVDAGGHPWIVGGSGSYFSDGNGNVYDNRPGAAVVVKLLP